ncbi:hypothetical protein [Thermogemmatispora carboxidivorans]|uniref:hypothetical protein n=1 Tax=Thermogemmatispora carboxidivorans TaxID=1382306 RepID=UPI00069BAA7D|nr:hypothetical protein [Thermogemmatispora carboxidivorans]
MLHPSPTYPRLPEAKPSEQKQPRATLLRPRLGERPLARRIKALLRPPIKAIYYVISQVRSHKLLSLVVVVIFLATATLTNYTLTGEWPLGIAQDQFNFHINGGNGGGDKVKDWLYALRDGDVATMHMLQSTLIMAQPPDPAELVSQYSEKQTNLVWRDIHVVGAYQQSDTTIDSLVSVSLGARGPGGGTSGYMLWHFTTIAQNGGMLLALSLVSFRNALS